MNSLIRICKKRIFLIGLKEKDVPLVGGKNAQWGNVFPILRGVKIPMLLATADLHRYYLDYK